MEAIKGSELPPANVARVAVALYNGGRQGGRKLFDGKCHDCGERGHKRGDPVCPQYRQDFNDPRAHKRQRTGFNSRRDGSLRGESQGFLDWKKAKRGRRAQRGQPGLPPKANRQCRFYLKGNCKLGDKCAYSHTPLTNKQLNAAMAVKSPVEGLNC